MLKTPLTTAIFDFHKVISALTTPLTTATATLLLVKTSLYATPLTIPTLTPSRVKTSLQKALPFPFIFRYFIFPTSSPLFFSPAKEAKNADNYDNTNEKKKGPRKVFGKYMKTIQAEFSILSFQNFRL